MRPHYCFHLPDAEFDALQLCRTRSPRGHLCANASRNAEGFYRRHGFMDFPLAQPLTYGCVPHVYPFS